MTILEVDAKRGLTGRYSFRDTDGQTAGGALDECVLDAPTVTCRWRDHYGEGHLVMRFDAALCGFQGQWSPSTAPRDLAFWNGSRSCSGGKPVS